MKNSKYIVLLVVVGFLTVSCSDFLDVNTDPNSPTHVPPNLILPVGLNYTAGYIQMDRGLNHLGNMMMYNYGEAKGFSWYKAEFKYAVTAEFYDQLWDNPYSGSLKQYDVLADLEEDKYGYYKAIGLIMEAYHFQILVDLYGDIPYTEALKRGGNPTPKYDDAAAVYDSLLVDLSNAVSIIKSTKQLSAPVNPGDADTMFGGTMNKWMQFANTVKIRILSRLSSMSSPPVDINAELQKIQSSGVGYITDDVMINPGYQKQSGQLNPMWGDFATDENGSVVLTHDATSATQFIIEFMIATGDTLRLGRIFENPKPDEGYAGYKGVNQGFPNDEDKKAPPNISNLKMKHLEDGELVLGGGGVLKSMTMGSTIFTLAEHKFNMAELAERGFSVGKSAQELYKEGIRASFEYLGLTTAAANNYLSRSNMWAGIEGGHINAIMTQQWLATMAITAAQAWFDYNRTGYPTGAPYDMPASIPSAGTGFPIAKTESAKSAGERPLRLHYPQSEITANGDNVPKTPDGYAFTNPIFWAE